jgi:hypothetical protein
VIATKRLPFIADYLTAHREEAAWVWNQSGRPLVAMEAAREWAQRAKRVRRGFIGDTVPQPASARTTAQTPSGLGRALIRLAFKASSGCFSPNFLPVTAYYRPVKYNWSRTN